MSYDLAIKSDLAGSQCTSRSRLNTFIAALPHVRRNGTNGFVLDEPLRRWMEIDLETVNASGDGIAERGKPHTQINCVQLHIPYEFFDPDSAERDYMPTARAIARTLGWRLYDLQGNRPDEPIYPNEKRAWWLKVVVPMIALFVLTRVIMWLVRNRSNRSSIR